MIKYWLFVQFELFEKGHILPLSERKLIMEAKKHRFEIGISGELFIKTTRAFPIQQGTRFNYSRWKCFAACAMCLNWLVYEDEILI